VYARVALAALLLCSLVAGCSIGGGATIEAPVTVYVSLPLTGPRGADGRDAADGARLALERASGKAGAIQVRARYLDDAKGMTWDPVAVGANARTAVQDSSAAAYIGELDSEPTRASVPITNDAGLVQVSPGAGGVDLTAPAAQYPSSPDRYQPSGSVNFARTVPSDDLVVDAAADWASELGVTAAVATSDGSAFQDLAAAEFRTAATQHGVQVRPGEPPSEVAVTANTGTQAVYDPAAQRLSVYGGAPMNLELSAELDPSRLPDRAFPAEFQRRFHRAPGPDAAYGYAAMDLVLHAIENAGTDASSFRDNVRNGVFGAHLDGTVLGSYGITSDGDTTECMIQRYRVEGATRIPLGAPCPAR
jgi:ABC-type branched-subunit amino acid transport system substrate-binding protein